MMVAMILSVVSALAQTNTTKHTVERGETLATIAQKYGTTEDKLKELNPDAAQFVYVGMELVVPETRSNINESTTIGNNTIGETVSGLATTSHQSYYYEDDSYEKWEPAFQIGFGFLPKPKGYKGSYWTYEFTIGVNYNITESFYVGARIGYNSSNIYYYSSTYSLGFSSGNTRYHFITLPIEAGYSLSIIPKKLSLIPYIGLSPNYCVKAKLETGYGSSKVKKDLDCDGDIGIGAKIGARLNIFTFDIGFAYVFYLNDNQKAFFGKEAYPEISIGWGF